VKFIASKRMQTRAGLATILTYCKQEKKTMFNGRKLVTGVNCVAEGAFNEMMNTKIQYNKTDGRMYYHLFQSFHPNEKLTPETAHEIALKLAEHFKGFEVLVATHSDREHIHSHFIVNSVNAETGKKYHPDKDEIKRIRDYSDKLCREYGLSVIEPKPKKIKDMSAREYRSADKGQSWKLQLAMTIDEAMKFAVSKEHFISLMENEGYEVKWIDTRKNITYTTPNGMRCRDNKLHEEKYLKEVMENEFYNRKKIYGRFKEPSKNEYAEGREHGGVRFSDGEQLESTDTVKSKSVCNDRCTSTEDREPTDRQKTDGLSKSDDGNMQEYKCRNERNSDKLSGRADEDNGRMFTEFETDSQGFIITGWETERGIFQQLITSEREIPQNNGVAYEDSVPTYNSSNSLVSDSVYLFAELTNIVDDSPVEDCTTMKQQKKERKNAHGGFTMSM
jgi:hypothetical protein